MSCCGSKRQAYLNTATPPPPVQEANIVFVTFRYTGNRSMTVTGGMTGRRYRFPNPGAEVLVDARDAPGMAAVPLVERVI